MTEHQAEGRDGRIITFYSYKGGTGRTMALANTAWILAANGYRVLAADWDLEAPGLGRGPWPNSPGAWTFRSAATSPRRRRPPGRRCGRVR